MIGIPLVRRKEDETPISPAPNSPISEIFSTNKIFFLNPYIGSRRSEIPRIESDYCPRDDISQRLFHQSNESCDCDCASDGCWGCLRRNKQCCCKILVLTLSTAIVVLLFGSLSYNLTKKQDVGGSLESYVKDEWASHYHKYNSSVEVNSLNASENAKNDRNLNLILPVPIINKSDNDELNDDSGKHQQVNGSGLHEVEAFTSYPYKVQKASVDPTYDAREPLEISRTNFSRRKRSKTGSLTKENGETVSWKWDLEKVHTGKKTKFGVVLGKLEDMERGMKFPDQFDFENARTVFQPFSLTMPDQSTPAQSEEFSFETNGIEDELKYKFIGVGPVEDFRAISEETRITAQGKLDFGIGESEEETSKWSEKVDEETEGIDGSFKISHHDDISLNLEKLVGVKGISLAEAKGQQKNSRKHLLLNSRVVGGSSDIKLPTAPDVSKPFMNAFETLKTSQQLSFTPSAASQFIFPYQMCFYANPHLGPRTSFFSSQPRTLPLGSLPLFSSTFDKNSPKEQAPPQQNFFSLSINNYANAPRPLQQIYTPPSGGSVFTYPSHQQVSQYVNNVPAPQGQPLFCTYLQPPLLQFPTVPGTADFSHAKCVDCENNHNYIPSSRETFFPSGREIICPDNNVSCKDGSDCIPVGNWCDNEVHCKDISDEMFCSCRERVARERLCDGYVDCPQGEDEIGCFDCPKSAFSCDSAISPESCIPLSKRCDGQKDCATGADETDCSALFFHIHQNDSYSVSQTSGYLHRNWKGTWYPVCVEIGDDIWAKEACLGEVGFSASELEVFFVSVSHQYKGPFIVRQENGIPTLQDHCKGHVSTYAKCSSMRCGTRVEFYSLQEFENRFRRFVKKSLEENFALKRDGAAPFAMLGKNSKKHLFPIPPMLGNINNAIRVKKEETGRVVGGKESEPRAWPWVIAIYKDGAFHCGGIILDEKWALTAAHCMEQYWNHFYEVRGGMLRRFSFSAMEQIRAISAVIVHENYDSTIMSNDVALLRLQNPFNFNRWVRPACLPSFEAGTSKFLWGPIPGTRCIAVGWGALRERGADPDQLREVEIPIMARCKHKEDLAGAEICAGKAEGGKDTCQGDSGGPLLCRDSSTPSAWYVAGIVSHGEGCGRPGEPGAYTRLSLYVDWITTNTNDFQLPSVKPLKNCPGFRCSSASRLCIPTKWVCNGFTDCLEAEDEMNCTVSGMDSDNFYIPYAVRSNHGRTNEPRGFLNTEENSWRTSGRVSNSKGNEEVKVFTTDIEKNKSKNAWDKGEDEFKDKIKGKIQFLSSALKANEKSVETTTSQYNSFSIQKGKLLRNEEDSRLLPKIEKIENKDIDLSNETRVSSKQSLEGNFTKKNDEKSFEVKLDTTKLQDRQVWLDGKDKKAVEGYLWNIQNEPLYLTSTSNFTSVIHEETAASTPYISPNLMQSRNSETVKTYSNLELYSTLSFDETTQRFSSIGVTESFKYVTDGVDRSEISSYFKCKKIIQFILAEYRCDGIEDCEDGTDEQNCTCLEKLKSSNPPKICDGEIDCIDHLDEKNCSECSEESYKCKASHECIPLHERCDGVINCKFGEDENNCLALGEISDFHFNANDDPLWLTKGLLFKNKNGIWDVQCQEKTSGFHDATAIEVCSTLGTIGYEKYENKSVKPGCTGFYVTCSEGLTSSLQILGSENKDYLLPWNAFVYSDGNLICSAVLIYPEWLLTSESCLKSVSLTKNHLVALLGSLDSNLRHYNSETQLIPIDDIFLVSGSDMALLYLNKQVNPTRFVRPTGIPYTFDSNLQKNVCIAVGNRIIFLKMLNDCSRSSLCYTKTSLESLNCYSKPWTGVIVCQSRLGWYPSSVFHEKKGYCGFRNVSYSTVQEKLEEIHSIIEKRRKGDSESNCNGFKCPEGFCIPNVKVCDGWPDCPSKMDEHIDSCHKEKNKKECRTEELKCRNGLCVGKVSFADGIDDCGDKSDEPLNSTCVEYLRLTAPQRICDGNRNCYDKTDENINFCPCNESKFKCTLSQHCIPQDFVCDGVKDCPGGEDEELCMGQKVIKKHNMNYLEIMQRSYGVWHTLCPSQLSKEHSDSLCRDLGYKEAALTYVKNETILLPQLNHFSRISLNYRTNLALRGDKPLVKLVRTRRICGAVMCT